MADEGSLDTIYETAEKLRSRRERLQLVNRKGRLHVRALPRTAENPTPAQVRQRIAFGEVAKETWGLRSAMDRALEIASRLRGRVFRDGTETPRLPAWALQLVDVGYTEEEVLEALRVWRKGSRD